MVDKMVQTSQEQQKQAYPELFSESKNGENLQL